jgi:hypothetical protein
MASIQGWQFYCETDGDQPRWGWRLIDSGKTISQSATTFASFTDAYVDAAAHGFTDRRPDITRRTTF